MPAFTRKSSPVTRIVGRPSFQVASQGSQVSSQAQVSPAPSGPSQQQMPYAPIDLPTSNDFIPPFINISGRPIPIPSGSAPLPGVSVIPGYKIKKGLPMFFSLFKKKSKLKKKWKGKKWNHCIACKTVPGIGERSFWKVMRPPPLGSFLCLIGFPPPSKGGMPTRRWRRMEPKLRMRMWRRWFMGHPQFWNHFPIVGGYFCFVPLGQNKPVFMSSGVSATPSVGESSNDSVSVADFDEPLPYAFTPFTGYPATMISSSGHAGTQIQGAASEEVSQPQEDATETLEVEADGDIAEKIMDGLKDPKILALIGLGGFFAYTQLAGKKKGKKK